MPGYALFDNDELLPDHVVFIIRVRRTRPPSVMLLRSSTNKRLPLHLLLGGQAFFLGQFAVITEAGSPTNVVYTLTFYSLFWFSFYQLLGYLVTGPVFVVLNF